MKKLLSIILALAMIFAFAACGKTEDTTPVEEKPAAEQVNILFSTTYQETETGGELVAYFANKVQELSEGNITVQVTYGGTLFDSQGELDGVASGAVQMVALGHNPHGDVLPFLCSVPDFAPDTVKNGIDYFNNLLFENADSSAVLQAEAEKAGIKYLTALAGGANCFIANFPFTDLTDLAKNSASFANMEPAKFEALGFTVEAVFPWDYYTAFDTGLVDASQMASSALASMGVQEVAPYWMYDNTYTAGNFLTVNLAWWNGLSAESQATIQEAADATAAFSVETYEKALVTEKSDLEAQGVTFVDMSDADFDTWWSAIMEAKVDSALATGEANGTVDQFKAVLKAAADFSSYDLKFE